MQIEFPLHFSPLDTSNAEAILHWQYLPPHELYNHDPAHAQSDLKILSQFSETIFCNVRHIYNSDWILLFRRGGARKMRGLFGYCIGRGIGFTSRTDRARLWQACAGRGP